MKVLVFGGSGKIGAAVAWDLVKEADVETVGIVGRRLKSLKQTRDWIGSDKVQMHSLDIADTATTTLVMQTYDVGIIALPDRRTSYRVAHTAIEAGLNIVDMLEEYHRRPDLYETEGLQLPKGMGLHDYGEWLHIRARENGVTFLDGVGFAPGISNVAAGEGIRKLDEAQSVIARVGGIPSKASAARHPLRYMITWAFDHVLREYVVKLNVIKHGKIVEVDAATELESFRFNQFGVDEVLECAITPGMPSFIYTRPQLQEFAEKTVRWPGHWQGVRTLKECGLLELEPVQVRDYQVAPREVLLAAIRPRLKPLPEDTDVCVMWVSVDGIKDGHPTRFNYYLWDRADAENDISSMARVTGFAASIAALFVGRGLISQTGIVPPEDCLPGPLYTPYIEALKQRNIVILETEEKLD
ncbi:MAG: saccharopine dehydrogenase NADP-binding domain-containing protein [Anaerolineae bacterium]|nr:saccharopine dehydrogenase NADP-binding domain-containing protein [Anaerolineae bacterium]